MPQLKRSLNNVQGTPPPVHRRDRQRERLIECAERAVAAHGLDGLRARDLAADVGCSVGAIYNLVADLDELTLLVAQRTLADLTAHAAAAVPEGDASPEAFVALALAYCRFAAANPDRWRALFAFRLPPGKELPVWFAAEQVAMFDRLEARLRHLQPHLAPAALRLRARTLFSAVHGIVTLGLEEKIIAMPVAALEDELAAFVRAYLAGLDAADADFAIRSAHSA